MFYTCTFELVSILKILLVLSGVNLTAYMGVLPAYASLNK